MSSEDRVNPPRPDVLVALNRSATAARLLSGAVHEVNNALQVIAGTVEMLEQQPSLSPAVVRALDRLRRQGARAAQALAEVLAFTKAPVDEIGRLNLREAVSHSLALRKFAITRAGLTADMLADNTIAYIVTGNRGQLQQAILNMIVNAEQAFASPPGTITVQLEATETAAGVRVTDSGPGIVAGTRDRLFEAFFSTRPPEAGAGLGLWAARTIAEAHGGTVTLEERETGTSVVMWLPRS